jgi:hypothetical protein
MGSFNAETNTCKETPAWIDHCSTSNLQDPLFLRKYRTQIFIWAPTWFPKSTQPINSQICNQQSINYRSRNKSSPAMCRKLTH